MKKRRVDLTCLEIQKIHEVNVNCGKCPLNRLGVCLWTAPLSDFDLDWMKEEIDAPDEKKVGSE